MASDSRLYAPAAQRNRGPILAVLERHLPGRGTVLEIASGSGEHVVHFAARLGSLVFQPSDPDSAARASIDAWVAASGLGNVRPALALDAAAPDWPVARADAVLCVNMIHIAPWRAAEGLVAGAARLLGPGGVLYHYGPYKRGGGHTAPSNAAFDADLRRRNPDWGVRAVEDVAALAAAAGFSAPEIEAMPANNLSLIFRRIASAAKEGIGGPKTG
jgi:SAM-dependent methyltransferase